MNSSLSESKITIVESAGKVLSQRNANRIKSAMKTLIDLMIDANVIEDEDLRIMLRKEESENEKQEEAEESEELQAGKFKLDVQYLTWSDRLNTTLQIFRQRFESLHNLPESSLNLEENQSREQAQQELLNDLKDVLFLLSQDYPDIPRISSIYPTMASSTDEVLSKEHGTHVFAFDCPVERVEIAAESKSNVAHHNRRPIQGVLFRIDEPSEAIPAVGPGLPLYIPRAVAEETLNCVCGLPLDADDSLSKHANKEIAGVIQSAEIKGNDYYVSGYMWPWSQSEKVQAISKNLHRLGMSMNAAAKGRKADVNGQQVFWVEQLQLLGANILYSDRATYRKTRLVAAEALENSGILIAATSSDLGMNSSQDISTSTLADAEKMSEQGDEVLSASKFNEKKEEETMSQDAVLAQLSALSNSINNAVEGMNNRIQEIQSQQQNIQNQQNTLADQVREVRMDLDERRAAIQASEAEQVRAREQQSFIAAIQEAVARAINPSGSPSRKTYPLAASTTSTGNSNPNYEIDMQLAAINGEMKALQESPRGNGPRMMQLLDEKRLLESKRVN